MYVFIFFFCFCPRIVTVALALSFLLHFPVMRGITLQVGALEFGRYVAVAFVFFFFISNSVIDANDMWPCGHGKMDPLGI